MSLGKDELDRLTEQRLAGANFVTFSRQVADDLISRARRAEELERENESRYSDREAFLADANLMVQEKTRIMHEVQELTTRMPSAALKFMGYALIEAGRNT